MATTKNGHIELLPSGSYRVRVYFGVDPVTGKERRVKRTVRTEAKAAEELANLLRAAEAENAPDDAATLGLALERYLEVTDLSVSTRATNETYIRRVIGPVLGNVKLRKIGPDSLDALYAHLRRCSRLCGRLPRVEHHVDGPHVCDVRCGPLRDHRTTRAHVCDQRCKPHSCKGLAPSSVVRIHAIISAAMNLAVRYEWIERNPAERATLPQVRKRKPNPPSPQLAARLLNHVWEQDEDFGLFLWEAMVTGARRGELLAQRENGFDFAIQAVAFSRNYLVRAGQHIEKDTKTGEDRWVSLDPLTCDLFVDFFARRRAAAEAVGLEVPPDAYVFSPDPLGAQPWHPDTMTHRYERYAAAVGIESSLKELRHYSATQLLTNGVDLSTVAGRLGHADGSTTLRFYAQFMRPADQHAATLLSDRLSDLRKKEQLRELFAAESAAGGDANLSVLAEKYSAVVGLAQEIALTHLMEFSAGKRLKAPSGRS